MVKSTDKPGTSPDYLPHSRRGTIWRRAPLPAPLLSTSTPKLPKTILTQVRRDGVVCVVCVSVSVFIWTPSPCIYRRKPPTICPEIEPNRHWGPTTPIHVSSERQWGPWAITTRLADLVGRPTVGWLHLPRSLVRRLIGGPPCHVYG